MLTVSESGVPVLEAKSVVRRRFILSLGFFGLLGILLILLMGGGSEDRIIGSGSTLAQPVIEQASIDYQARLNSDDPSRPDATGDEWVSTSRGLDYEPVGSLGGILRLNDPEVDFAVADYPLTPQALEEKGLVQFPLVIGGVAVVHNLDLPGSTALRLDAATLADIYMLRITRWSDPKIAALNPGALLPDLAINPVHRSDGSGSTYNVSAYLAQADADWASVHGVDTIIDWPGGSGVARSSGMIDAVSATPGSIGYAEVGQAERAGLKIAALQNAAGAFVSPGAETLQAAMANVAWDPAVHFSRPLSAPAGADAYPVMTVTYALMRRRPAHPRDAERTLRFLGYLSAESASDADRLGFLPLPPAAIQAVRSYWRDQLNFNS